MKIQIIILILASYLLSACQPDVVRAPSATSNVQVLAKEFDIPGLNRSRKIRLYLPPDYASSDKRYPVLYMHDGQNLFDAATSYAGEWGVDETLNKLHAEGKLSLIVVGIDNGEDKRMNELSPWENSDFGAAEGRQYMDFIVKIIKPYIDSNYHTLPDANHTAIMGSSMGGLITHYAMFEYPHVFTKGGIFSPSFWFSDKVFSYSQIEKLNKDTRLYFVVGEKEGNEMVNCFDKMTKQLKQQGLSDSAIYSKVVKNGEHNEAFWRNELEQAILWMFR